MQYCSLEEAWGSSFKKKKSKKERKLEKMVKDNETNAFDSELVIPKMADKRLSYKESIPNYRDNLDSFDGYDQNLSLLGSPYSSENRTLGVTDNDITKNNKQLENSYNNPVKLDTPSSSLIDKTERSVERNIEKMITISESKLNELINKVEGFENLEQTDEQFNQLILYIFTGIIYLFMLDMMYQLGKKSY